MAPAATLEQRPVIEPLGNAAYTDPEFFAAELRRAWSAGWFCLGFAHEVPETGSVKPSWPASRCSCSATTRGGFGCSGMSAGIAG